MAGIAARSSRDVCRRLSARFGAVVTSGARSRDDSGVIKRRRRPS
jgi:hypothetical protein